MKRSTLSLFFLFLIVSPSFIEAGSVLKKKPRQGKGLAEVGLGALLFGLTQLALSTETEQDEVVMEEGESPVLKEVFVEELENGMIESCTYVNGVKECEITLRSEITEECKIVNGVKECSSSDF